MPLEPPSSSREQPLGVADVVRLAGRTLDGFGLLWLEGEVVQISRTATARGSSPGAATSSVGTGHVYFALGDRGCVLSAVMWATTVARTKFIVEPGKRVRVRGRLGVYDRDGKMQLYVDFAEPAGLGEEARALEALKQKLAAEGMFAAAKKRALPRFPRRIGVVTSAQGAAIHDIIRTIHRRFPTPILIADAMVQGPHAPAQLVAGMAMVVRAGVDVLIIGRGGGSASDLTAFNHERVVRTISRCPVPVICAVGHETDLSLADLAADVRCSTPTAAAEHVVPDGTALRDMLVKERRRLDREIHHVVVTVRQDLDRATDALHARGERVVGLHRGKLQLLERRLATLHPRARLATHRRELDALTARTDVAIHRRLAAHRSELGRLGAQMAALSPLAILDRGFAMVTRADGEIVRDAAHTKPGDRLRVRFARGELTAVVDPGGDK